MGPIQPVRLCFQAAHLILEPVFIRVGEDRFCWHDWWWFNWVGCPANYPYMNSKTEGWGLIAGTGGVVVVQSVAKSHQAVSMVCRIGKIRRGGNCT